MSVLALLLHAILSNAIHQNSFSVYTVRELINHHVNGIGLVMLLLCVSFTISIDLDCLPSIFI